MTVTAIRALGFCAHYSKQGDWAFDHALRIAQKLSVQLNVFHFLSDPYDPDDRTSERYSASELATLAIERERHLRLYYDERAGDYLDVGFRLCHDDSWLELHRCLMIREFQVLFLADPGGGATFAGKPIEEFAYGFVCPVVLVGPYKSTQLRLNASAAILADRLELAGERWYSVRPDLTGTGAARDIWRGHSGTG